VDLSGLGESPVADRSCEYGNEFSVSIKGEEEQSSSVVIANSYELDDSGSGVRFPAGLGIFLFTTASRPELGPI
jgi:hypothetical protein